MQCNAMCKGLCHRGEHVNFVMSTYKVYVVICDDIIFWIVK